jgi:neutral ceramidase
MTPPHRRNPRNLLGIVFLTLATAGCGSDSSDTDVGPRGPADNYLVGSGAADITGPIVDLQLSGFTRSTQIANGIQTRLTARAFIFGEADQSRRLVFVVTDLLGSSHEVRLSVVDNLRAKYGDLYSLDNVIVSATHTHSAPGGYSHGGSFSEEFFDTVVSGVTEAIDRAHQNLKPGHVLIGQREVEGAGAQRSLPAYMQNPEEERARYQHDTDRNMTLLKLVQEDGAVSVLNWFAVHPTSLTYDNKFVSGDHKAFAALEMERRLSQSSRTQFVAGFANANCGDVTSNLNLDNTGPGTDDLDSARIIGERQLDAAMALFDSVSEPLSGPIDVRLTAVDMADVEVSDAFTGEGPQRTCPAAQGYSFGAGSTEDGGGNPAFVEGMLEQDEGLDSLVQAAVGTTPPSEEMLACHAPKPILFTGSRDPVPIGVATIGQLALVFLPGEITTMAGRRMRDTVRAALGDRSKHAVIAAYSNDYTGYITTPEEYDTQQYEGGHTLFGRWTLPAYQQEIDRVSRALVSDTAVADGADQGDLRGTVSSGALGNDFDEPPASASFGDVVDAPQASYAQGDTASVSFWTGHPGNALRETYIEIQRRDGDEWRTIATENDWFARARWTQASRVFPPLDPFNPFAPPPPTSTEAFTVLVIWEIRPSTEIGTYRVLFHGSERSEAGAEARLFTAESPTFEVTPP